MLNKEFKEWVDSGKIRIIQSALNDYLVLNNNLFDEACDYIKNESALEIFQKHNGKAFETDSSKWNKEYLSSQRAELMLNFSRERTEHIKNVVEKVIPKKEPEIREKEKISGETLDEANLTGRKVISEKEIKVKEIIEKPKKNKSAKKSSHKPVSQMEKKERLKNKTMTMVLAAGLLLTTGGIFAAFTSDSFIAVFIITLMGIMAIGAGIYLKLTSQEDSEQQEL